MIILNYFVLVLFCGTYASMSEGGGEGLFSCLLPQVYTACYNIWWIILELVDCATPGTIHDLSVSPRTIHDLLVSPGKIHHILVSPEKLMTSWVSLEPFTTSWFPLEQFMTLWFPLEHRDLLVFLGTIHDFLVVDLYLRIY